MGHPGHWWLEGALRSHPGFEWANIPISTRTKLVTPARSRAMVASRSGHDSIRESARLRKRFSGNSRRLSRGRGEGRSHPETLSPQPGHRSGRHRVPHLGRTNARPGYVCTTPTAPLPRYPAMGPGAPPPGSPTRPRLARAIRSSSKPMPGAASAASTIASGKSFASPARWACPR